MVNSLRLTVAYLNATINMKPDTQNRRSEPTGLAKLGQTRGMTGTGPGLARQESAGRVFGRYWNRTDPILRSKPGLLAGYPDPLLTLHLGRLQLNCISTIHSSHRERVIETSLDVDFGPRSRFEPNICPNNSPGYQSTKTVSSGTVPMNTFNRTEFGRVSAHCPVGPTVDSYNALVFAIW